MPGLGAAGRDRTSAEHQALAAAAVPSLDADERDAESGRDGPGNRRELLGALVGRLEHRGGTKLPASTTSYGLARSPNISRRTHRESRCRSGP